MEELLEVELLKVANKEKTVQVLGERTVSGLSVQLELIPFDSMFLYVAFLCQLQCFPLSNLVCFIIVKALKQEIEVLKEEIGNAQLEKAHQVKIPEPQHGRLSSAYVIYELLLNLILLDIQKSLLITYYKYIYLYSFLKPFTKALF